MKQRVLHRMKKFRGIILSKHKIFGNICSFWDFLLPGDLLLLEIKGVIMYRILGLFLVKYWHFWRE